MQSFKMASLDSTPSKHLQHSTEPTLKHKTPKKDTTSTKKYKKRTYTKTNKKDKSKWIIRITLNIESMLDKNITMDDIHFAINNAYKNEISCLYSDYNDDKLVFRIRLNNILQNKKKAALNKEDKSIIFKKPSEYSKPGFARKRKIVSDKKM